MENGNNSALYGALTTAASYCAALESVTELEKQEFIRRVSRMLAQLYLEFSSEGSDDEVIDDYEDFFGGSPMNFVDEEYYNSVRHGIERLMGEDDIYLEAFHEEMKYSDTPVSASISEGLADIFQDLYNFISEARDSDTEGIERAFQTCRENFRNYWGQIACNLMRPLHYLINV